MSMQQKIVVGVVVGLQVAIAAAGVCTLVRFGSPRRRPDSEVSWLIVAWAGVSIIDAASWITVALGAILPYWVYIFGFTSAAAMSWWRTWLIRPPPPK